ncbi:MAG: 2-C-methyl-D-erythritol 4-phosphate cytidylyltransferase [Flavobacteriales bacterium]|nr:2-C-methyl-D-erythritol 4-phosphate cytidylyltransferase [Flavobacteriales bacterium]
MKKSMIIVAGGSGTRMGAEIPKQFIELNGKPILMHTLQNLHDMDTTMQLILVLPASQFSVWDELKKKHGFLLGHELAAGGATRFLSVKNGLAKVKDSDVVGVHDGVRPFPSKATVDACFAKASSTGAAVPTIPIVQSLRKLNHGISQAIDRNEYCAVQTPQCFQVSVLKKAFDSAVHTDYSDDATVVEATGQFIHLIEGNLENIKITTPIDLELAQLISTRRTQSN